MILQILARCGAFFIGFIVKGQMNHDFAFGIEVNPCVIEITIGKKILTTHDVAQIKKFGRQVSNYNENRWNGIRQIVVYEGLLAKFSQNLNLKDLLKATGDNLLAECAVKDKIWGVGLSMSDPDRLDITKWKGQNLLGYSLMMVREKI